MYSTTRKLEYSDVSWTNEREYTIITNSDLGLIADPFPLISDDFLDVRWPVVPDVEDLVESQNHIIEEHESIDLNIRMLAKLPSSDHPGAIEVLSKDTYVDDVNPSAETEAGRDDQMSLNQLVLKPGGFGFA